MKSDLDYNNYILNFVYINSYLKWKKMIKGYNRYDEHGVRQGYWIVFIDQTHISHKGYYVDGIAHGYWMFYNIYGRLSSEGNFFHGKRKGYWKEYNFYGNGFDKLYYV